MTGLQHPLVQDYLARVESSAAGLPPAIRAELLADLAAHLDSSLTPTSTDGQVQQALTELGDPHAVVVAAYEGLGLSSATPSAGSSSQAPAAAGTSWGPVETICVVALIVGSFVVPLFGSLVGLVLAWVSRRWSRGEKAVATLLFWGPLLVLATVAIVAVLATGGDFDAENTNLLIAPIALMGPVVAGIYLAVRVSSRRDRM
jgi:uncharacterized membrane protein